MPTQQEIGNANPIPGRNDPGFGAVETHRIGEVYPWANLSLGQSNYARGFPYYDQGQADASYAQNPQMFSGQYMAPARIKQYSDGFYLVNGRTGEELSGPHKTRELAIEHDPRFATYDAWNSDTYPPGMIGSGIENRIASSNRGRGYYDPNEDPRSLNRPLFGYQEGESQEIYPGGPPDQHIPDEKYDPYTIPIPPGYEEEQKERKDKQFLALLTHPFGRIPYE